MNDELGHIKRKDNQHVRLFDHDGYSLSPWLEPKLLKQLLVSADKMHLCVAPSTLLICLLRSQTHRGGTLDIDSTSLSVRDLILSLFPLCGPPSVAHSAMRTDV